jgi:hypothetical protein
MKTSTIRLATLCLFGAAAAGCFQMEYAATLLPNGSGKIKVAFAMKKSTLDMMRGFAKQFGGEEGPDPLEQFTDPRQLEKNSEGIVAWSKPEVKTERGWERVTMTAYFEDISKVKIYQTDNTAQGGGERKLLAAFDYTSKADGGGVLIVTNGSMDQMGERQEEMPDLPPEMRQGMMEMMKPMVQGLKISLSVTVPGEIEETVGFTSKKGSTAAFSMTGDQILEAMDPESATAKKFRDLRDEAERNRGSKVTWPRGAVSEEKAAEFKKELEAAKETWKKLLDEAKEREH